MNLLFLASVFTWLLSPASNEWENQANWSASVVPGEYDSALFLASIHRDITVNIAPTVGDLSFNGRQDFRITIEPLAVLHLNGHLLSASHPPEIVVTGAFSGWGGQLKTTPWSDLGHARLILQGVHEGNGAQVTIRGRAGNPRIYVNRGTYLIFDQLGSAGTARILSKPGGNGEFGGQIYFYGGSQAPEATIILAGATSFLQIQDHLGPVTLGELRGKGTVFVGPNTLTVTHCNNFTGTIDDQGRGGTLQCLSYE